MVSVLKIAIKGLDHTLKVAQKRKLFGMEVKAPCMLEDYCDILDTLADITESLLNKVKLLNGTKIELISRTFATSQTFRGLVTEAAYRRLKDRNRRKRIHFFKMKALLYQFDAGLLIYMHTVWNIGFVKVEYRRGKVPWFLDIKKHILKRFDIDTDKLPSKLEMFSEMNILSSAIGHYDYGFQLLLRHLERNDHNNLACVNKKFDVLLSVRDRRDIWIEKQSGDKRLSATDKSGCRLFKPLNIKQLSRST